MSWKLISKKSPNNTTSKISSSNKDTKFKNKKKGGFNYETITERSRGNST